MHKAAIIGFLACVARGLKHLPALKVLRIMCPTMHCAPIKYIGAVPSLYVHTASHVQLQEDPLQEFKDFAERLDAVIIRGIACDLIFGVAGRFQNARIKSLRSVEWVDNASPEFPELCNLQRLRSIANLSHLTERHMSLIGKSLQELHYATISQSIGNLRGLRKVPVIQNSTLIEDSIHHKPGPRKKGGQGTSQTFSTGGILRSLAGLTGLLDLDLKGHAGRHTLGSEALFARRALPMVSSLTRFVLHGACKRDADCIAPALERSNFPVLEVFRAPSSRFVNNKVYFLAHMPKLRELELQVKRDLSKPTHVS